MQTTNKIENFEEEKTNSDVKTKPSTNCESFLGQSSKRNLTNYFICFESSSFANKIIENEPFSFKGSYYIKSFEKLNNKKICPLEAMEKITAFKYSRFSGIDTWIKSHDKKNDYLENEIILKIVW